MKNNSYDSSDESYIGIPIKVSKTKYTKETLIEKFNNIHNKNELKYSYFIEDYKNVFQKIKIKCLRNPSHGEFQQYVSNHLKGKGCPKCAKESKLGKSIFTQEEVIKSFKEVHKDKYDYSKVEYKTMKQKVEIMCPIHGIFKQQPLIHKQGGGCQKCGRLSSSLNKILTQEEVIKSFKEVHKDKYDYSKVEYINNDSKVIIICPEHGQFLQRVANHKNGFGCPKCSYKKLSEKKLTPKEIIEQFEKVHDKYDYSKMVYFKTMEKVEIICPIHGSFFQKPNDHKNGQGCPSCKINKAQDFFINLFKEYNIKSIRNDRNLIKPLEIDILVPDFNFGIEHNGLLYHSYGISNWNATNNYSVLDKNRHLNKTIKMEEQEYQLFHIREDHFLNPIKKEIWKSILLNKCKISTKIHARKLVVVDLNPYQDFVKQFLEENHLQGNCPSGIKLGLQDPKTGVVYSIMTFGKSRFDKTIEYELLRFCNLKYHNVRGAASKLMSAFEKYYKPKSIVSYANRDWSQGNLYQKLGFVYNHISEPNYIYTNLNRDIISRQQVQKHKLKNFLESKNLIFYENLSERDNMIGNGYRIYYDTGNLVYHKKY